MSQPAIVIENLGKKYKIGLRRKAHQTFPEAVAEAVKAPFRRLRHLGEKSSGEDIFWALKDVSFEVQPGEVVGIIGRNGAGKSTLLKILSRITEPTTGRAVINGRVGSLLEVGTGFHPELTGRENVYLNGAILGMKKTEIALRFDEIVAFAEIETFLDTPVKRYSSGMRVRLAFAVAAHLEPEILIVDEVLAVGDAAFQRKCLGKMQNVAGGGRTVLFVSHNMAAISGLCQKVVILEGGQVVARGDAAEMVDRYMAGVGQAARSSLVTRSDREGNQALRITGYELCNREGSPIPHARCGDDLVLALQYETRDRVTVRNVHAAVSIRGRFEEQLCHLSTDVRNEGFESLPGQGVILCAIDHVPLQPGIYTFNVTCTVQGEIADWVQGAGTLEVEAGDFYGTGKLPLSGSSPLLLTHAWGAGVNPEPGTLFSRLRPRRPSAHGD